MDKSWSYKMVKEDIVGGLKLALSKGESLQQAMMTFYNSGYKKQDIEEAAKAVQSQGSIQELVQKLQPGGQAKQPAQQIPKPKKFLQRFRPKKPVQQQTQQPVRQVKQQTQPEKPVQQLQESKKPKGKALLIFLIIVLAILLGILISFFLLKEQIIAFFNNLLD